MKFAKGIAMGALITTGVIMMTSDETKRKAMKKGKQIIRKMRSTL